MAGFMPELTFGCASIPRPRSCCTHRGSLLRPRHSTTSLNALDTTTVSAAAATAATPATSPLPFSRSLLHHPMRSSPLTCMTSAEMVPSTPEHALPVTPKVSLKDSLKSRSSRLFHKSTHDLAVSPPIIRTPPSRLSIKAHKAVVEAEAKAVLIRGERAKGKRLVRKKFEVRHAQVYELAAPGREAVLGDVLSEGEEEEEAPWSAPPRIEGQSFVRTPRLPELNFGVVRAAEEVDEDVCEDNSRRMKFYRCDIFAVSGIDFRAAMAECKQMVFEASGRTIDEFQYLAGFLYSLPIRARNPLADKDQTALGGYITITSWDPFSPPRFDPLRMNPYGGQGDRSPTRPTDIYSINRDLHFGSPMARSSKANRAQSAAQLTQDAKSWRKAADVLGMGRTTSMDRLKNARNSYAPASPYCSTAHYAADLDDDDDTLMESSEDDEWESVMSEREKEHSGSLV